MADNHTLQFVQARVKDLLCLSGHFTASGTSAPTALVGIGYTVARSSTGVYVVTLQEYFPAVQFADANIVSITPTNTFLRVSPIVGKAITITCYGTTTTGTAAVADVPLGYQVHFRLDLQNSSQVQ